VKWLWFYIVCWKHRNDTRFEFFEQYTLVLKAARRCGYDLSHAATDIFMSYTKSEEERSKSEEFYSDRSQQWLEIFAPTGAKDYRHKLHMEIWELERKVDKLKKLCEENGIQHDIDEIPF
jgi:hypothetical protein